MITRGFEAISKEFDIRSNVFLEGKINYLYGPYKNLAEVDKADEELIIKDVQGELQNLTSLSPGQDKFIYDPEALMVKVTARLLDKYYPLDKPRPEV